MQGEYYRWLGCSAGIGGGNYGSGNYGSGKPSPSKAAR